MTLNTTYKPAVAQGNGIIKEFSYSFNPISSSYIRVYFEIDGKWVEQKTGWSATVSDSGGIVTFLEAPNTRVSIERDVPESQPTSYTTSSGFQASVIEHSFDLLTGMVQELKDASDRSVKVEVGDNQTPEELLQTVYDKLDSATEIAGDAISAANQAQTAADNATAAVNSAEQTLANVTAYVDSAKVEIDNTKNTAIETIGSTVAQAKADINTAVDEATMNISNTSTSAINTINTAVSNAESNISTIVSDAEGSITNIAVTEANKAIANAAQGATDTATANLNSYVDGTVKPSLQTYVDQAQEDANSAATSMEQAALSATSAANAAQGATDTATANLNSYVDGTVKPSLQTYVDQAEQAKNASQTSATASAGSATAASNYASNASAAAANAAESAGLAANSAAAAKVSETNAKASETNALIWAEGTDAQVQALGGEKSAKGWAEASTNLDYTNITNCITEIPQDIKVELNNGTLTLKAGSKYYKCDGSFTEVTITEDKVKTSTTNAVHFIYINNNGNIEEYFASRFYSGNSQPTVDTNTSFWFDTSSNIMKKTKDKGSTWVNNPNMSLPLAIVTVSNGAISSIDQVFNGFGYIGSTVFALPGVKGVIPNGRNADGSLKNIEVITDNVTTSTFSSSDTRRRYLIINRDKKVSGYINNIYKKEDNINVDGSGIKQFVYRCGSFNTTSGTISNFTLKTAFHAVDRNESSWLSGLGMPSGRYIDLTLGASGSLYKAPANGWVYVRLNNITMLQLYAYVDSGHLIGSFDHSSAATYLACSLPTKRGKNVQVSYGGGTPSDIKFVFYYAEGEAN